MWGQRSCRPLLEAACWPHIFCIFGGGDAGRAHGGGAHIFTARPSSADLAPMVPDLPPLGLLTLPPSVCPPRSADHTKKVQPLRCTLFALSARGSAARAGCSLRSPPNHCRNVAQSPHRPHRPHRPHLHILICRDILCGIRPPLFRTVV